MNVLECVLCSKEIIPSLKLFVPLHTVLMYFAVDVGDVGASPVQMLGLVFKQYGPQSVCIVSN